MDIYSLDMKYLKQPTGPYIQIKNQSPEKAHNQHSNEPMAIYLYLALIHELQLNVW